MLVKAKWNVRDAAGWHRAGEVFETSEDLGDAVEVLSAPKKAEPVAEKPEKQEPVKAEEPAKEPAKAKTPTRRKKISE